MRRTSKLLVFLSILAIFTFGCQLFSNNTQTKSPRAGWPFVATTTEVAVTVRQLLLKNPVRFPGS